MGGMAATVALGWRGASAAPARRQRGYNDMTWWDPYVEDITDVDTYLRRKFRQDVTDKATGVGVEALKKILAEIVASGKASGESWRITKAKLFAAQIERQSIDVSPLDWFPAIAIWDRLSLPIAKITKGDRAREVNAKMLPGWVAKEWQTGNAEGRWLMWQDFDHSVPDWRVILKLGFPGMKARLEKYAVKDDPFYESCRIAMDAILAGIDRFAVQARKNFAAHPESARLKKEIACLERLRCGPPQTAYDMMMFVWLYFFCSEHLDGIQCRSLTELDVFLAPYYAADVAAGRTTEAEFRGQLRHFLWQWGSAANYYAQPVGIGGTKKDGTSEFGEVTRIILDLADELNLTSPKFIVKVAENTPEWAWTKLLDMARRRRSVAFLGEESASRTLKRWKNASEEDCRTMAVRGCYEFGLANSLNTTDTVNLNLLFPVVQMLDEARKGEPSANWSTFEAFKAEYLQRVVQNTVRSRKIVFEIEKVLADVNPANCMTLATDYALKTRQDGFATGCPRGNDTTLRALGLGSAVDALLAVEELVYEKKELSLAALGEIMAEDWKGHETLRLRMLRSRRKWGNNDAEANALGAAIIDAFASNLNGIPNSRGGIFLASGHSSRRFIELGKKTPATPDGRRKGDELSKNLSPTMGADTEGATALVATLASSTAEKLPSDYPLDVMLHPSVCQGERGLMVMRSLVRRFHRNGGGVIQFTVFSVEMLRDAQAHPKKYENLQVRICGWNVRWNDMCKAEQDAYIRRAETTMKGW